MRILLENGAYSLLNMGDVSMLQVAVRRVRKFFPNAVIIVLTERPDLLAHYCPDTVPLLPDGRDTWSGNLINKLALNSQINIKNRWKHIEEKPRYEFPYLFKIFLAVKLLRFPKKLIAAISFLRILHTIDLAVATGGGYITDAFMDSTKPKLLMLRASKLIGKPTVMLGQGLGPLNNSDNYQQVKQLLSIVDFISIREDKQGKPLLQKMEIDEKKILTTGDEAIELAYDARNADIGNALGLNLRIAVYSDVSPDTLDALRGCIQAFAKDKNIDIKPIPIDHTYVRDYIEPDSVSIQKLLKGFNDSSDGGASLKSPLKIIQQVGLCRVVVTGSYHAGVFALSQGIPVIGLAKSQYYIDKFSGLAEQFPNGCQTLLLSERELSLKLTYYLHYFWDKSEELRPSLLKSAQYQIGLGYQVYENIFDLVQRQ